MKKLSRGLVTVLVLVVLLFGIGSCAVGKYNTLIALDESVTTQWAQVQNQYQRRLDLIPNLVSTVKGYAKHESDVFTQVSEARASAGGQVNIDADVLNDPAAFEKYQKIQDNLSGSLQRLLMVTEQYPELKADQQFLALQDQLEGTENRIAVERQRFNDVAKSYNTAIRSFPTRIIASFAHLEKKSYFAASTEAQNAPKVEF
ncbi:MAG: LemA family protein [Treponema sp.]|jgi:LemA protein|nr:LemA family protein [Treponema sp.]